MILVHVRFKVRDKGLWTAVLAVIGCGVMPVQLDRDQLQDPGPAQLRLNHA
jgi:uncharacterized membrane protein YwaF